MQEHKDHRVGKPKSQPHREMRGFTGLLLGVSLGLAVWLLLMLLTASVLCKTEDPARLVLPSALLLAAAGAFACGFAAGKLSGFRPLVCGGAALVALLGVSSLLSRVAPSGTETAMPLRIAAIAVMTAFAFFGAAAALGRKKGKKSRRKHGNSVNKL